MIPTIVKEKAKVAYARIIVNKLTTAFFVFSFILCFAQGIIQSFLFSIDADFKGTLHDIISTVEPNALLNLTQIPSQFHTEDIPLWLCNDIPIGAQRQRENCSIIFDTTQPIVPSSQTIILSGIAFPGQGVASIKGEDDSQLTNVSHTCAQTLLYAHQNIRNFNSEDLTFIILQFWLLGISVMAVVNDSAPHLFTVLVTRALMTVWSIYSVWRTRNFQDIFGKLYADPGTPCHIDFFPAYFPRRTEYEIPDLVLNITGFLISCWFSWALLRTYNAQAMRYVGAPEHVNRIHKLFLAVLSCLQLGVFVLVTAMGLWVDVLRNTAIHGISTHTSIYLGATITTSIILIPWICLGWYGIRCEMKKTIALFFFFGFAIIVGWSIMFYSLVYRWTLLQWPFLASLSMLSFILVVSSTILAIICRFNFNRGLKQYLHAEAALAQSGFSPEIFRHDEEKGASFDLDTADFKKPAFSPTSITSKYEQPMPTYLALPHKRSGSADADARFVTDEQVNALGAPLQVPRLAERPTKTSTQDPSKYGVRLGESF
ncbi:hypothetical protein P691DRAFT_733061 [Macrolepiota fuliginosa MF-IS2]|uniref:Uncharacterized protein n=1 Tax=Macrolepiota fuliginosa MF-IS2 TaxID=1400762 RepID=A0A9P6C2C5_9AGAR|nr:hypothetical protein P691DRAFT_733061 [Macrolepiota fuliginosa MF-IS2]